MKEQAVIGTTFVLLAPAHFKTRANNTGEYKIDISSFEAHGIRFAAIEMFVGSAKVQIKLIPVSGGIMGAGKI
jgi:hypothetical protein